MIYQQDLKRSRPASAAVVDLNSIPLEELPSGDYYLVVKAYNGLMRSATDSAMVARRFTLYNPAKDSVLAAVARTSVHSQLPADAPTDLAYAGMRESELDREYSKVKYIATPPEKKIWDELNGTDAKARFLTLFWLKRDPSPGTPENEERDAYFKRVDKAQHLYTSAMTPNGWDSDRGRILLQFGAPDVEERHFQDYNRKPFETWKYGQLGYEFDFVDRSQTGTFVLVHSTAPGEVHDENWETDYAMIDPHFQNR
jgi:GWxTD domain-containing protein